MRKMTIAVALALSACGGGGTTDPGHPGNPVGANPGTAGYTYPQACVQFCQAFSTRALNCVRGQGHWTQQDLQRVTASCNQAEEANHIAAADCETASAELGRSTCSQICHLIGETC